MKIDYSRDIEIECPHRWELESYCSGVTGLIPDDSVEKLIKAHGPDNPLIMMEEPAELIKAISKCYRGPAYKHKAELLEEMADTLIVMDMLMYEFSIDLPAVIREVLRKMDRNLKRIEEKSDDTVTDNRH